MDTVTVMFKVDGYYRTVVNRKDGSILDTDWNKNQIQDSFYSFITGLVMGYNFGLGTGLGINYLGFGSGNPAWYSGTTTFGTLTSSFAGPYTLTAPGGSKFGWEADGDVTKRRILDEVSVVADAATLAGLLNADGVFSTYFYAFDDGGKLGTRTLTPGSGGSVKFLTPDEMGVPGTLNHATELGFDNLVHSGTTSGGTIIQPSTATALYNEFARQEIDQLNWKWIDWTTKADSAVPSDSVEISIDRGFTTGTEAHGEFGLFGAASSTRNSGKMINWVARSTQINKGPRDTLNTTIRLHFYEATGYGY